MDLILDFYLKRSKLCNNYAIKELGCCVFNQKYGGGTQLCGMQIKSFFPGNTFKSNEITTTLDKPLNKRPRPRQMGQNYGEIVTKNL